MLLLLLMHLTMKMMMMKKKTKPMQLRNALELKSVQVYCFHLLMSAPPCFLLVRCYLLRPLLHLSITEMKKSVTVVVVVEKAAASAQQEERLFGCLH